MSGADRDELRGWLEPLAPADAARLLAEARREAEQVVRTRLVDAFTEVMLEGIRAELGPARPRVRPGRSDTGSPDVPPEPTEPTEPPGVDEVGWYVHCVVGSDHPPPAADLPGIEPGATVQTIHHGALTAIVSPVDLRAFGEQPLRENLADLDWLERVARAHERVQEEIARDGTPIPMRLCSIYRDRQGVRDMLEREATALGEALAHLSGRTEWGVQIFGDSALLAEPARSDRDAASDGSSQDGEGAALGTSYLRSRLAAREAQDTARERLDGLCAELHGRLARVAVDAVLSPPQRPEASGHPLPMILNGAYLVDDARRTEFDRAVAEVIAQAEGQGMEVRRTGPWPPYNFVHGAIGAGW